MVSPAAPPAAPPASPPRARKFIKGALLVGGLTALVVARGVLSALGGAAVEPFHDEDRLELEPGYLYVQTYQVLSKSGRFSYDVEDTLGSFSLYLIPDEESGNFMAERPFMHVAEHAYQTVRAAKGEIALPRGDHALAIACEDAAGCDIALAIDIRGAIGAARPALSQVEHAWRFVVFELDRSIEPTYHVPDAIFGVGHGFIDVELASDRPVEFCITTPPEYGRWLTEPRFEAIFCERDATNIRTTIPLAEGKYAIVLQCYDIAAACEVRSRILYRADESANPFDFAFEDSLSAPILLEPLVEPAGATSKVSLAWIGGSSAQGEPVWTTVYVDGDEACAPAVDTFQCVVTLPPGTYTWEVVAKLDAGRTARSTPAEFVV